MSDRESNAVWGAIVGATLGAPLNGRTEVTNLSFYQPVPTRMSPSQELDIWCAYCQFLSSGGDPTGLSQCWADSSAYRDGAMAFAAANIGLGLNSPCSGAFDNPLGYEAGALGRTALWGILFPDRPLTASMWTGFDASIDHSHEGVWTAVALSAALAMAKPGSRFSDLASAVSNALPSESKGHKAVSLVFQCASEPDPVQKLQARLPGALGYVDPSDAPVALANVLIGLATGRDFGSCVMNACSLGGPASNVGTVCGAIAGAIHGVPQEWRSPLGQGYVAGHGLRHVEPPETIESFVQTVLANVQEAPAVPVPEVAIVELSESQADSPPDLPITEPQETKNVAVVAAVEEPVEVSPKVDDLPKFALPDEPMTICWAVGDLTVEWRYLSNVRIQAQRNWKGSVTCRNRGGKASTTSVEVTAPTGWAIATNGFSGAIEPGSSVTFGVVVQPSERDSLEHLSLKVADQTFRVPVLQNRRWFIAGPFEDSAQKAFDALFPPERSQKAGDRFSGRSNMAVNWEPFSSGRTLDIEPHFQSGPGVCVLWAKVRFAGPAKLTMVAAGAPGVVVRVDGNVVVRYLDTHVPVPRNKPPYAGTVQFNQESEILIKVIRDRQPFVPLVLYWLDENGSLVEPETWLPMPE